MLGDISAREKYRILKKGLNNDLTKAMLVFEGIPYGDFVAHATRIDPALLKKRQDKDTKAKKSTSASSTVSKDNKSASQSTSLSAIVDSAQPRPRNVRRPPESQPSRNSNRKSLAKRPTVEASVVTARNQDTCVVTVRNCNKHRLVSLPRMPFPLASLGKLCNLTSTNFRFLPSTRSVKDMPSRTLGPTGTPHWANRSWKHPLGLSTKRRLQSRPKIKNLLLLHHLCQGSKNRLSLGSASTMPKHAV